MKYQICSRCVMDTSDPEITFTNSAGGGAFVAIVEVLMRKYYLIGEDLVKNGLKKRLHLLRRNAKTNHMIALLV